MTATGRVPEQPIDALFHERWSPRAFTAEEIPQQALLGLFEAARWAPSASNLQPWRFVYARRGTPAFARFLATLAPGNQAWADQAAALVAVVSHEPSGRSRAGGSPWRRSYGRASSASPASRAGRRPARWRW